MTLQRLKIACDEAIAVLDGTRPHTAHEIESLFRAVRSIAVALAELAGEMEPEEVQEPKRRTVSEVLEARKHGVLGGCCDRFADHSPCDCLAKAIPDEEAARTAVRKARV